MICLGRSHYFRFNHPAEAKFMRSILPNVRLSMAPIAFYPAVDNPEYFHMSAQEAGLDESATVFENSTTSGSQNEGPQESKPTVLRKKTPPSSLSLPNNKLEGSPKNFNDKVFQFEGLSPGTPSADVKECSSNGRHFFKRINQPAEDSDSDVPPEVPPRSEGNDSLYVNSPTFYTSVSQRNYLGEYINSKTETDPSPNKVILGTTRPVGIAATVVSPNGMTTVHNALYRSLPPVSENNNDSPAQSPSRVPISPNDNQAKIFTFNSVPQLSSPLMATNPSYCLTSASNGNKSPSHLKPFFTPLMAPSLSYSKSVFSNNSSEVSSSPAIHSYMNTTTFRPLFDDVITTSSTEEHVASPSIMPYGVRPLSGTCTPLNNLADNLVSTEMKKLKAVEDRLKDEEEAKVEKERLDEILSMCAEYERQQKGDPSGVVTPTKSSTSPYHTLTQNRIKTNGSLPREKRSPMSAVSPQSPSVVTSPIGSLPLSPISPCYRVVTPSDDESSIFSFEGNLGRIDSQTRNAMHYPPFPNATSGFPGSHSPPPCTPRSPYENVSYHGYSVPQSPRTRIRTTVGKERQNQCEVFENKMAISDFDLQTGKERYKRSVSRSPELSVSIDSSSANWDNVDTPPKLPRSPRIERGILDGPSTRRNRDIYCDKSGCTKANVIGNKYFVSVTSKSKSEKDWEASAQSRFSGAHTDSSSPCEGRSSSSDVSPHINTKFKTKVFEEHMLKNIQDTLNINDLAVEIDRLTSERKESITNTAELKIQIIELERQENESLRELEMERALLEGELQSMRENLFREEKRLSDLLERSQAMEQRHTLERENDQLFIERCKDRLEEAEEELEMMEEKKEGSGLAASSQEEKEILETLKAQHETVDAEKKVFEDTEFSQMESEALRESEREELNKEILESKSKIKSRKGEISQLELQMFEMTASVCKETETLENQRQDLLILVNKERMRLTAIDRQFGELARLGVISLNNGDQTSPTCSSSDTEESSSPQLSERLAKLHLLDRSQEDLDKINQITISSPLDCHDSTLGRKTSATLMEIEKKRQRMLAKQGTMAIDKERKRVEELKRRVAQEVKEQWEEKKAREQREVSSASILREEKKFRDQREINCSSLNSIGSEDSSMTSSDLHTESLSSDDIIGQRISAEIKIRQRDPEAATTDEQCRPLSDASSFCDTEGQPVKFRDKPRNQQRPLTRFLPVRTEENFNLRQHIESAGHQIELCPYLSVNETCCRGYLHKLGSKFRTWHKRWFVFDRSKRALLYYSDKNESKPRGGVYFQAIEEVYVNHLRNMKSPSPKLTFCVKTRDRTFQLMASSPEAMRIWIDVIFTGAEGYNEFQGGT